MRLDVYDTLLFDRDRFLHSYHRHLDDARAYFANRAADYLEMNIPAGDGRVSLCEFLDRPVPGETFPHVNQARYRLNLFR